MAEEQRAKSKGESKDSTFITRRKEKDGIKIQEMEPSSPLPSFFSSLPLLQMLQELRFPTQLINRVQTKIKEAIRWILFKRNGLWSAQVSA